MSPDGRLIATAGRDRSVRVWEAATGRELFTYDGHTDWVEEVRFSPDGKLLATASLDGTARIIDVAVFIGDFAVAFSPGGERVATSSHRDDLVRLWDPDGRAPGWSCGHTLRGSLPSPSARMARGWPRWRTTGLSGCGPWTLMT